MQIKDVLAEGRPGRKKTVTLYHGTTSEFLPSIKKHGLLPYTENKSFGSDISDGKDGAAYESYGGVYLTNNPLTAQDAAREAAYIHGGDPIIITVQYVKGSGGLDEDYIFDTWFEIIDNVDNPRIAAKEAIEDLQHVTNIRSNTIQLVNQFFAVVDTIKKEKFEYDYDNDIRADPRIREVVKELISSVKNTDAKASTNVRVTRPIGFKGKTRITGITKINKDYF